MTHSRFIGVVGLQIFGDRLPRVRARGAPSRLSMADPARESRGRHFTFFGLGLGLYRGRVRRREATPRTVIAIVLKSPKPTPSFVENA